jgi:hypothetical protein
LKNSVSDADEAELTSLLHNSERIQELSLSKNLSAQDRAEHIRAAAAIAKRRFDGCAAKLTDNSLQNDGSLPSELQPLKAEWDTADELLSRRSSLEKAANQDDLAQLVFNTEQETAKICGTPTGDDALLLLLAKSPHGTQ